MESSGFNLGTNCNYSTERETMCFTCNLKKKTKQCPNKND